MSQINGIALSSKQVQLVEPTFDEDPMTTADSVVCTLVGVSGILSTTNMTYTDDLDQTNTWGWYGNINLPASAQSITIRVEAIKAGTTGRWRQKATVKPF